MKNLLPNRETGFYGWLLIGFIGLLMLFQFGSVIQGLIGLYVYTSRRVGLYLLFSVLPVLGNLVILGCYVGILLRVKESIVGLWVGVGCLWLLNIIFIATFSAWSDFSQLLSLVVSLPLIGPIIVTVATHSFWSSFRLFREVRAEGFSHALLRPLAGEEDYPSSESVPRRPPPQATSKIDDEPFWF